MESLSSASISAWSILSFIITIEIANYICLYHSLHLMSTGNSQQVKHSANAVLRSERLKEIDALYRNQIKEIYAESKLKAQKDDLEMKRYFQGEKTGEKSPKVNAMSVQSPNSKSTSTLNAGESSAGSKIFHFPQFQDKTRASTLLKGESTRTIEFLRKDNQTKQLKIRELTNKCQILIQKLKESLQPNQFQREIQHMKEHSDNKMQRLQNLFKIKSEEIFFKVKLQIINLLQEFGVIKQELSEINDIANQGTLFTFMSKKLKGKLKDFRNKEQESGFELQKDKIMNQKQEERIHYLVETNELLRLSQSKLKGKIEDLKSQLNEFLQKLREKQVENEELQSQLFQLKKLYQQLNSTNIKLSHSIKALNSEGLDERRTWQAKQKQMKNLLNNYFVEKKKLQSDLEEAEGRIEEILIQKKFLEQENERLNRDLVRWKERYEWIEKENDSKIKELQSQLGRLSNDFDDYKGQHNQAIIISHQNDVEQALRKVEQYQRAYESVLLQLEDQKRLFSRAEQQYEQEISNLQKEWLERVKRLQKIRQEELFEFQNDHEARQLELRDQYQKKEKLFAEEMQAHMRALLAQKDKKTTEQMVALQSQNDTLRRQIQSLKDFLRAKQDFINIIRTHSK